MASMSDIKALGFSARKKWLRHISESSRGKKVIPPSDEILDELKLNVEQWMYLRKSAMDKERKANNPDIEKNKNETQKEKRKMNIKRYNELSDIIDENNDILNERYNNLERKLDELVSENEDIKKRMKFFEDKLGELNIEKR